MLNYTIDNQFEAMAEDLLDKSFQRVTGSMNLEPIFGEYIKSLKDGKLAGNLEFQSVNYKADGTTEVQALPKDQLILADWNYFNGFLEREGQTLMVHNRGTGETRCFALFEVNGTRYLHTYEPNEAQRVSDGLTSKLVEPKEPSAFDKVCDFFARKILKRPGKVVGEYNAKKQFNDTIKKMVGDIGSIADKVEEHKQAKIREKELAKEKELQEEKERLEKERQEKERQEKERLEKEKLEKERLEKERLEKEKLDKILKEEQRKQQEEQDRLKRQQQEKTLYESRAKQIGSMEEQLVIDQERLPKAIEMRNSYQQRIQKLEPLLAKIKPSYETQKKVMELEKQSLTDLQKDLVKAEKDIQEMETLREFNVQRQAASGKMEKADLAIKEVSEKLKKALEETTRCRTEWEKVATQGHIYEKTVEQYLEYRYEPGRKERAAAFQERRKKLEDEINKQKSLLSEMDERISEQEGKSTRFEKSFLGGRTDNGKRLSMWSDLKKQQEKALKTLLDQAEQMEKDFQKEEARLKKEALTVSPEKRKELEKYLSDGKADHSAKLHAFRDAEKAVDKLLTEKTQRKEEYDLAKASYNSWDKEMKGKSYDQSEHENLQTHRDSLYNKINTKKLQISNIRDILNDLGPKVRDGEKELNECKEQFTEWSNKVNRLNSVISAAKSGMEILKNYQRNSPYYDPATAVVKPEPKVKVKPQLQPKAKIQPQEKTKSQSKPGLIP